MWVSSYHILEEEIRIEPQWNVNKYIENLIEAGTNNQNRTIVECKYTPDIANCTPLFDQNRTIVECKYNNGTEIMLAKNIRIEPQWNVNVNPNFSRTALYNQNRTIVECKYISRTGQLIFF